MPGEYIAGGPLSFSNVSVTPVTSHGYGTALQLRLAIPAAEEISASEVMRLLVAGEHAAEAVAVEKRAARVLEVVRAIRALRSSRFAQISIAGVIVTVLSEVALRLILSSTRALLRQALWQRAHATLDLTARTALRTVGMGSISAAAEALLQSTATMRLRVRHAVDLEGFKRDMDEHWRATGSLLRKTLLQQTKLVVERCIDLTPPFSGKRLGRMLGGDFGTSAAKTIGQNRVARDIGRVFFPVNKLRLWHAPGFKEAVNTADEQTLTRLLRRKRWRFDKIGREPDHSFYWSQKNNRGNVKHRPQRQLVLNSESVARYIKERQRWVGYAKSGWAPAALKFGARLPAWISRHGGPGFGKDLTDQPFMRTEFANQVPYIQAKGRDLRIIELAISAQAKSYAASLRRDMEQAARTETASPAPPSIYLGANTT